MRRGSLEKLIGDDALADAGRIRLQSQVSNPSAELVFHSHCTSASLETQATVFYKRPLWILQEAVATQIPPSYLP